MFDNYFLAFSVAWAIYILVIIVWIIMEKRPILATLCWVLSLALLPYIGFIIYYFIGPQKITRHKANIYQSRLIFKQSELHGNTTEQAIYNLPTQAKSLAQIIYRTCGYPADICYNYQQISGGKASFKQIFADVIKAKKFIFLEYYIYETGVIGDKLRDLLTERARNGVKIYLLLDSFGSRQINKKYLEFFLKAGGKLAFFHDIAFLATLRRFRPALNMRTHRKILICDGEVAITGGINISDMEDLSLHANAYYDLNIRFNGPAVTQLMRVFMEDWHYSTKEDISELVQDVNLPIYSQPSQLVHIFPSGPDNEATPLLHTILTAINQAEQRIWLTTPYFIPTEQTAFALASAALRGIDVKIILPQRWNSLLITLAARSWYDNLLNAGVEIYQFPANNLIHSKSILVDGFSIIGSSNFDNRSFMLNFEVTVVNYNIEAAQMLRHQFEQDLQQCQSFIQISKQRSYLVRLAENSARLLSPLL